MKELIILGLGIAFAVAIGTIILSPDSSLGTAITDIGTTAADILQDLKDSM